MKRAVSSAKRLADRLTDRQRDFLAWLIDDEPYSWRTYHQEEDATTLTALGIVAPYSSDSWGAATALGKKVWNWAKPAWVKQHEIGAALKGRYRYHRSYICEECGASYRLNAPREIENLCASCAKRAAKETSEEYEARLSGGR